MQRLLEELDHVATAASVSSRKTFFEQTLAFRHELQDVALDARSGDGPEKHRGRRVVVHAPPGARLIYIADFLFSPASNRLVFVPTVRDLRDEYAEALTQNRPWKARMALLRGYAAFWSAVAMKVQLSLIKKLLVIWKVG